jgi:hypothetical protein
VVNEVKKPEKKLPRRPLTKAERVAALREKARAEALANPSEPGDLICGLTNRDDDLSCREEPEIWAKNSTNTR